MMMFALFGILAVIVLMMLLVTFIGGVGMFSHGPRPSEGDDSTG